MPLRKLITTILVFSSVFCFAQESAEGYLIECEASKSNEDVAFFGPAFKSLRPQANTAAINVTYSNFPNDAKEASRVINSD